MKFTTTVTLLFSVLLVNNVFSSEERSLRFGNKGGRGGGRGGKFGGRRGDPDKIQERKEKFCSLLLSLKNRQIKNGSLG